MPAADPEPPSKVLFFSSKSCVIAPENFALSLARGRRAHVLLYTSVLATTSDGRGWQTSIKKRERGAPLSQSANFGRTGEGNRLQNPSSLSIETMFMLVVFQQCIRPSSPLGSRKTRSPPSSIVKLCESGFANGEPRRERGMERIFRRPKGFLCSGEWEMGERIAATARYG